MNEPARVLDRLIEIRPMEPGDADAVLTGFGRLSEKSLRSRFFTSVPKLTPGQRADLVKVDPETRTVLLAVLRRTGEVVGGARYYVDPTRPGTAEVAVTVGDCWQHHGLGRKLLRHLRRAALAQGIDRFTGYVLVDNGAARHLLRTSGALVSLEEPGTLRFVVPLTRDRVAA